MSSRNKCDKKCKTIISLNLDRLHEDPSFQNYVVQKPSTTQENINKYKFPLNQQIQSLLSTPDNKDLSQYVKFLENQVKTISNNIQYEYHQKRQTILFLGQTTGINLNINRKKIDDELIKQGVVRLYDPKSKNIQDQQQIYQNQSEISEINDVGDLAIKAIKKKIQIQWEMELGDQIQKEKRKQKQLQRKKIKQLQQIQKDFQKLMKKRKLLKEQLILKSQKSIPSQKNLNGTPKKQQKIQKIIRKASQRIKNQNSVDESVRESNSILNQQPVSEVIIESQQFYAEQPQKYVQNGSKQQFSINNCESENNNNSQKVIPNDQIMILNNQNDEKKATQIDVNKLLQVQNQFKQFDQNQQNQWSNFNIHQDNLNHQNDQQVRQKQQ